MNLPTIRVCAFESRRRDEMQRLIVKFGGQATVAPSMQEVPITEHHSVFEFAERLFQGQIDVVIFLTGVGTESLLTALRTRHSPADVLDQLNRCRIVARGPKPAAVLSGHSIRVDIRASEPNTWQEVVHALQDTGVGLDGKVVAIQEYGEPAAELAAWLTSRQAEVLSVPIYRWALPDDVGPLEQAIRETIDGEFDLLLWTSAQQVNHTLHVAEQLGNRDAWLAAANQCVVASIGPTASQRLRGLGLPPDFEPSHPKMGHLAKEAIQFALHARS